MPVPHTPMLWASHNPPCHGALLHTPLGKGLSTAPLLWGVQDCPIMGHPDMGRKKGLSEKGLDCGKIGT